MNQASSGYFSYRNQRNLSKKAIFKMRPEWWEGSHGTISAKIIPGRGNSKSKGPEAGVEVVLTCGTKTRTCDHSHRPLHVVGAQWVFDGLHRTNPQCLTPCSSSSWLAVSSMVGAGLTRISRAMACAAHWVTLCFSYNSYNGPRLMFPFLFETLQHVSSPVDLLSTLQRPLNSTSVWLSVSYFYKYAV